MPVPAWSTLAHSITTFAAPVATGHLCGHAAFVQKHQALRVDSSDQLPPRLPPLPPFFRVLFTGVQRFFYVANPAAAVQDRVASC